MLFLFVLPIVLIGAAAVAALVAVRRSSLRITADQVEFRNYPQPARVIPLVQVARFEPPTAVGYLSSLRPRTCVLVLTDGTRLPVRSTSAPDAGHGIDALNDRLDRLRRNG